MAKVVPLVTKGGARKPPPDPATSPPRSLMDRVARQEWLRVAPGLSARGMLTPDNELLIVTYCNDVALIAKLDQELKRQKLTIPGPHGVPRPHPLLGARNKAHQGMIQLGKRLGILGNGSAPQPTKGGTGSADAYTRLDIRP